MQDFIATYSAFSLTLFAGALAGVRALLTRFAVSFANVAVSPTLFGASLARFAVSSFGVVRWRPVAYYLPGIENLNQ